jgi:hypothetical protein
MADYNQTDVSGKSWQRCNQVLISNPRHGAPMVRLSEEVIVVAGDKEFAESLPGIHFEFDPNIVIQMRNPETGEVIPGATMTGLQVYAAMFSLYIQKAQERDALIAP